MTAIVLILVVLYGLPELLKEKRPASPPVAYPKPPNKKASSAQAVNVLPTQTEVPLAVAVEAKSEPAPVVIMEPAVDRQILTNAVVWSEILGAPRAYRPYRYRGGGSAKKQEK